MKEEDTKKLEIGIDSDYNVEKTLFNKNTLSNDEIQIIVNEYNLCNERIESFLNRQDSILQISMAILGGAIAFTTVNKVAEELYVAIPAIPIILFTHILYHYTRVIANQGYRRYLQSILNDHLPKGRKILYSDVGRDFLLKTNPVNTINSVMFPMVVVVSILYSIFMSNFNLFVLFINIFLILSTIIIGYAFVSFIKNLDEKVQKYCEEN